MLICLLIFELMMIVVITLSHKMLQKKYKEIEKSTHIYMNKRAYRTQKSVVFIDNIVKKYLTYTEKENEVPDLYSMIKSSLLKEYIGRFPFTAVNNVAHKAKHIMWGIVVLEMAIAYINNVATSLEGIVVIISSILLTIGMEIFIVINALEEKKETTIVFLEDYILNAYPLQVNKSVKSDQRKAEKSSSDDITKKVVVLEESKIKEPDLSKKAHLTMEDKQKSIEHTNNKKRTVIEEGLTEKDIIEFIRHLNKI